MAAAELATVASGADARDGLRRRTVPTNQDGAVQRQPQVDETKKAKKV